MEPLPAAPSRETAPPSERPTPTDELALPLDTLSLQTQPELVRQLVQLYRLQLRDNPNDSAAATALHALQERALTETTATASGETAATTALLKQLTALFPELADDPRYLALQSSLTPKVAAQKPAAETEQTVPPPRPRIEALSMVSGIIDNDEFIPRNDGGVLQVSLSYRNFSNPPATPGDDTLILRIRAPGNPLLLAEVPLDIAGDRGTRNFRVETPIRQNTSDYYQLDLILGGRVLESRIVARADSGS